MYAGHVSLDSELQSQQERIDRLQGMVGILLATLNRNLQTTQKAQRIGEVRLLSSLVTQMLIQ